MELSNGERKYLLGVVLTQSEYGWTRLKWVADLFGVKLPTAKEFLDSLTKKGLLDYQKRGAISLTKKGKELADKELKKLNTIVEFITRCLYIDKEVAMRNALKIMFDLDEILAERMYQFIEVMNKCAASPRPVFIRKFEDYVRTGEYIPCAVCPYKMEGGMEVDGK